MRRIALLIMLPSLLVLGAQVGSAGSKATFKAMLTADGHAPKVKSTWKYHVRVTDLKGHPIAARITSLIVDPLGSAHPVEFDGTGHNPIVKNFSFFGNFCDSITWPVDSGAGVTLKFETVVVTAKGRKVLVYPVTPKS
jgi:hypothetical protein